ncbi:alpha/beta fold hydrolase BchO [Ideonella sp. A 288]|uniref:alpha/beta fold hydrolase BchO n=1 Tax=Ideonella sp. A 288 TaxID=1962181 RepID=UPI001F2D65AC|nr:alpha/beta fold hydrolase BchO [Ideonella sp. A 288]
MSAPLVWARDGRDWPLREASHFVKAAGQRWHVQRLGEGPTVLLLHGTGASTHSWRKLAPLLAQRFEVLMPDLPGHGFSAPLPDGQCSLPGMAAALSALLAELHVAPQAVLGHSAGAALMLRLALDQAWAGRVLIGLNAALLPFEGLAGVAYAPMARLLARSRLVPHLAAWRARDPRSVRRLIGSTGSQIDDEGVALYARLLRNPGHVAGVLAMMSNWNLQALQHDLPALRCPLRLLAGAADTTVPPAQAERVARRVPGARAQHLPGLGHLAHEEAPGPIAELVAGVVAEAVRPALAGAACGASADPSVDPSADRLAANPAAGPAGRPAPRRR